MNDEWLVLKVSNDLRLPCLMCIGQKEQLSDWRDAKMKPEYLRTMMQARLRSHITR